LSTQIIGLSGYARAGKDQVGQALVKRGWIRVSFADQIRQGLYLLNPLVSGSKRLVEAVDQYGWETAKTAFPEIRELMQRMGGEFGRDFLGENTWIELTLKNAPVGSNIVVTDCRWPNEAEIIKNMGGQMWRVKRPDNSPANSHPGEVALDNFSFDLVINNDGSISDLEIQVGTALNELKLSNSNRIGDTINGILDAGAEY